MTVRAASRVAVVLLVILSLGGCVGPGDPPQSGDADEAAPRVLSIAPNADGDCSAADPCSWEQALRTASSNTRLELGSGGYGDLAIPADRRFAGFAVPLVITVAPGAEPDIGGLRIAAPAVRLVELPIAGLLSFDAGADDGVAERVHVTGSGMFVRADRVRVIDSVFEGGSSVDGIQITRASDVLIEGNEIHDYDQELDNGRHSDCIQIFDATGITVRGNRLANCSNAGIIVSGDGGGVHGLLIEANFVQGCIVKSSLCTGGTVLELREQAVSELVVRNNTFLNGPVRWGSAPGAVFDRNIVAYLSDCDARITATVVAAWNAKLCGRPAWLDAGGNRAGEVTVRDAGAGDLTPVDAAQVRIDPAAAAGDPAPAGIDGAPLPVDIAGAAPPA